MKAAVYYAPDDIRYEELPRPRIGKGEILVRVRSCGLCGTDISKIVERMVSPPVVLGHEVAGDVVEAGEGVEKFRSGDRVFVAHHVPCFTCHYCRHGNHSLCQQFRSTNIDPGGFAEYIRVPAPNVEKTTLLLPKDLSYEEASLIESTACCLRAIRRCPIQPGDTVVVVGVGPMGLLNLQLALLLGVGQVIALDLIEQRLEVAKKFGAKHSLNPEREDPLEAVKQLTEGRGADVAIVSVGETSAIAQAIRLVRGGGTVTLFAECPPHSSLSLDPNIIYHSEVNLRGSYSSTPEGQGIALELMKTGKLKIKELITHRFPLKKLSEAVTLAREVRESLKIIITP
ncbi:alcohol dehydrogenase catalytic domain-containing protein [candidate division NPL-UPA2 bacterium]|nr:alcohol dehydrogenase catalytic domain-containing protein [candidate division NPL-UPA2 bacterium]